MIFCILPLVVVYCSLCMRVLLSNNYISDTTSVMRSWANEPMHIIMMLLGNTIIYAFIYVMHVGELNRQQLCASPVAVHMHVLHCTVHAYIYGMK